MDNTIVLVTPNNDTFTNPTLTTLFHMLEERGVEVYMFGPEQQPSCPDNITNVRFRLSTFKLSLIRNPKYYKAQLSSYSSIIQTIKKKKIQTLLAVDPLGIIIGGRVKRLFGDKLHLSYLSFEIFFKQELSDYYLKLKKKEVFYSKFVDSLLTQDEKRKVLLYQENKFTLLQEKVALVPVSPLKIEITEKPDIHEKLKISREKKLAIYSGSVGEWCGTKAIIEAFNMGYWCDDYHLVFHTRKPIDESNEFFADLTRLDQDKNISFTLHPRPFDSFEELSHFLSGFDLALALYYPNNQNPYYGMNMKEIGLSSGKFSTYMMLGLPTIVTPCDIYEKLLNMYSFGSIIYNIAQIKEKLNEVSVTNNEVSKLYIRELNPLRKIEFFIKTLGY